MIGVVWIDRRSLDRLVDLSAAVRYEGAALDSCLLEEKSRGAVVPEDQDVEATPEPSRVSLAPPARLTPAELTVICAEISGGMTGRCWIWRVTRDVRCSVRRKQR